MPRCHCILLCALVLAAAPVAAQQHVGPRLGGLTPAAAATAAAAGHEVVLDERAHGSTITLARGQTLRLTLAETAGTGYRWAVEDFRPAILEQADVTLTPASPGGPGGLRLGGPGSRTFLFTARRTGETPLVLELRRPWEETGTAAKTVSLRVIVTSPGAAVAPAHPAATQQRIDTRP